jgi:hypothetical protein
MTIWWTSGYHCLTCGSFSVKGCKEHRAGNIPAKAIIEATLDDIKILSDGMAEMLVAELKGEGAERRKETEPELPPSPGREPEDILPDVSGSDPDEKIEEPVEHSGLEVPEHFLVSEGRKEFRCSCGLRFETEHVFLSHIELESQRG